MQSFQSILSECIDLLRGGATVDDCLERYPRHADRLRPVLALAEKVQQTPLAAARPGAKERGWKAVQARAAVLRQGKRTLPLPVPPVTVDYRAWLKPAMAAAGVAFLLSAGGSAVVYASQDALPDSPLYSVKLASEDVRLWFVFDDTHEAAILLDQSNERMDEIMETVANGKPLPERALTAMQSRNERAANILSDNPDDTSLRARVLSQAQHQEERLVALWPQVPGSAQPEYAQALADLHNTRLDGGAGVRTGSVLPEELAGGILTISGQAEELEEGRWQVGGVEVHIDDRTIGQQDLQPGTSARFVVARASNGRLHVLSLASFQTGASPTGAVVSGAVEKVSNDGITVAGNFIPFSDDTLRTSPLHVGQQVQVTLSSTSGGIVADSVHASGGQSETKALTFEGTVEDDVSRARDSWSIGGLDFAITPNTTFDARAGSASNGTRVEVEAVNRDGRLEALRIAVLASQKAAQNVTVIGTFEGFDRDEGVWHVSGIEVVPPETGQDPPEGAIVTVDARRDAIGLVATSLITAQLPETPQLARFQGTIGNIEGSLWTLEFGEVKVASTARVQGAPAVGVRVILWAEQGPDGSLQARYVRVLDDVPVLTPTPAAEPAGATSQ